MQERTQGVILRIRLLTDSSLIVHWLTPDVGRISTVAKGARRTKSPFRGKLDLFHVASISFQRSRRSELHLLRETVLEATFPALRIDWRRLSQAAYGVSLVEETTERETALAHTYAEFLGYLAYLDAVPVGPLGILALELKHLAELGMLPDFQHSTLPLESQRLAGELFTRSWNQIPGLEAPEMAVHPLAGFLQGFLVHHFNRLPRGRQEALGLHPPTRL